MKIYTLLLLSCLTTFSILAQRGLTPVRNVFDISISAQPIFFSSSMKEKQYKVEGTSMTAYQNKVDLGATVSYIHYTKRKFALGFFGSVKDMKYALPTSYDQYYLSELVDQEDSISIRLESLKFRTYYLAPRFEFITKEGYTGIGLSYDLALGVVMASPINGSYGYSINEFGETEDAWSAVDYYQTNLEWKRMMGFFIQTGFKVRLPLAKNLAFHSAFHYTVVGTYKSNKTLEEVNIDQQLFDATDLFYKVQRQNLYGFTIDAGISLLF